MTKLVELIVRYCNTSNILIPDSLTDVIIENVVDNRKFMKDKLESFYSVYGQYFYLIFRPFYNILTKIKNQ